MVIESIYYSSNTIMRTETRNNGLTDVTVLIADNGKVLRRISTNEVVGFEVWLGKSYYIGGVKQDPPHDDVVGDFDEIDKPEDWPDYEPVEDLVSDSIALNIITGR